MIDLPDSGKAWQFENGFYLTCQPARLGKLLAHHEAVRRTASLPGAIVECGVFKGVSFCRLAMLESLVSAPPRRMIGFDTFGPFPEATGSDDCPPRERFVEAAGDESIDVEQLQGVLQRNGCGQGVELVAGDICQTVPDYVARHPELRISLLNLDVDLYEPAAVVLQHLYPRLVRDGILLLDDYGVFPGETRAADEYLADHAPQAVPRRFPWAAMPCYVVKE